MLLTESQVAKLKAKHEAERAAAAAKAGGPPSPPPAASAAATPPPALDPAPPPRVLDFSELSDGTLRALEAIVEQLGARGVAVTPDIPFAALTLAAMMLTDGEGFYRVDREHFARLALAAYDRAVLVPASERGGK